MELQHKALFDYVGQLLRLLHSRTHFPSRIPPRCSIDQPVASAYSSSSSLVTERILSSPFTSQAYSSFQRSEPTSPSNLTYSSRVFSPGSRQEVFPPRSASSAPTSLRSATSLSCGAVDELLGAKMRTLLALDRIGTAGTR